MVLSHGLRGCWREVHLDGSSKRIAAAMVPCILPRALGAKPGAAIGPVETPSGSRVVSRLAGELRLDV
ncbi:hypothetical protein XM38_037070 [Halomicronema hongdechloris C2206]|uniref:Uncharacterized protein n=1 Tax=Halomicronema hongdechloris C2206 TaxID=1641165 RepID=A0A1Z3HR35_9CYAN|nr:hypothetical protein XM38_037070 [Halomicronema hongdechloris C2206]